MALWQDCRVLGRKAESENSLQPLFLKRELFKQFTEKV
jgi:hypothetical protein